MCSAQADVRYVPIADIGTLFDHLVGARLHCRRHVEAERLSRLQIDVEPDFGGLLDRQVARFFALENPAGINARQAVCLPKVRSVAQQTSGHGEVAVLVDRWHRVAERQCGKLFTPAAKK